MVVSGIDCNKHVQMKECREKTGTLCQAVGCDSTPGGNQLRQLTHGEKGRGESSGLKMVSTSARGGGQVGSQRAAVRGVCACV